MLALQFATATANLASQNAFLFLATRGPIFIASFFTLPLNPVWIPVLFFRFAKIVTHNNIYNNKKPNF
jgi:hypothetical protein